MLTNVTSTPSLRVLLKVIGTGTIAIFILLSVLPNASTLFFTWPWVFYGQLLLFVPIFLLGWDLINKPSAWRPEWTFLGAMALAIGASVIFSRRPALSMESALFLWSGLAWCGWIAVRASAWEQKNDQEQKWCFRTFGLVLTPSLLASLTYWLREGMALGAQDQTSASGLRSLLTLRNLHPFGHWNYTGGFALLVLPWFGALILIEHGRWRALWVVNAFIAGVIFFSAASRGAVLGALAMLAATFFCAIFRKTISHKQIAALALAGVALAACLWSANPRLRAIAAAPTSVFQPNEGDVQRISMLQGGLLLAMQRPWIGHGPGMTPFVYPEVRAKVVGGVETAFQLHNGPLQLIVDHGLIGIICAVTFAAILLRNTLRWLKSPASIRRTLALGCACSLVGYGVMFITDYQLNVLIFDAILGLQAGLLLAGKQGGHAVAFRCFHRVGAAMLAICAAIFVVLVPAWRARYSYWRAWETDSPAETIPELEKTVRIAPRNPYYLNQLALRRARLSETASDSTAAGALRVRAREELTQSLTLDPAQEPVHESLGWLWLNIDPEKAGMHFLAAIELLPDRDSLHFGLALSQLAQGDQPSSIRELALECLVNPLFLTSPFWTQEPLAPLKADVLKQLFENYDSVLQNPSTPKWRKPQLLYAKAFVHWWRGGRTPNQTELEGALPTQKQFFDQLLAPRKVDPSAAFSSWDLLIEAWGNPAHAEAILRSPAKPPSNEAIAGAVARLSAQPLSPLQLLRSPAPNGVGIVTQKITRGHYAILNSVIDGPGYEDLAPRLVDSFTIEYAGLLFPMRCAIPGPAILDLMKTPPTK